MIRFAQPQDIPAIISLCEAHARYEEADYSSQDKAELLGTALFTKEPDLYCLVADEGREIVGYATYMLQYSTWDAGFYVYMDCLFILEQYRGKGIGEKLIRWIQKEAGELDCSLVQWQTPDFNQRAIKFYKRIGAFSKAKKRFFLSV